MMRLALTAACAALLAACAGNEPAPSGGTPIALRNADFEAPLRPLARCPDGWACVMHSNPDSYRFVLEAGSLCVERVHVEPFATVQQSVPAASLQGRRVRLSLRIRGGGFDGEGAGPIIIATRLGAVAAIEQRIARVADEWRRYEVEMTVPRDAEAIEVGMTLLGGGRACLDDARLEAI
jgi:hypothetical protein